MSAPTAPLYSPGYLIAGKYELESVIGEGGMGAVWRARNVSLEAPVAIKVLRAVGDQALLRGRLMQEARSAAKLSHQAIVKVFDVGQTDSGDPFIVMELLEGDSLGKVLLTQGRLTSVNAVQLLLPIADALWLAHEKGIVHRDLKPDNVFIVQREGSIQPTLVDFGIVKVQEAQSTSHLTQAGDVVGSPDYMSPEQARGQDDIDHATDIWSFCVVLYEAISGQAPFQGANYNALLRQIVEAEPPSLRELSLSDAALSDIVCRGLAKQPKDRFASMGELGRTLATWLLAQGVTEDICGTTLEAKWLRADGPTRAGRAAFASVSDAWTAEASSGVRRQAGLEPLATIPAPAEELARGSRRSRWVLGGIGVTLLAALAWAALAAPVPAPSAPVVASPSRSATALPAASEPEVTKAPEPSRSVVAIDSAAPSPEAAPPPPKPVSSRMGRPLAPAKPSARPARPSARGGTGAEPTKTGDLLSPY